MSLDADRLHPAPSGTRARLRPRRRLARRRGRACTSRTPALTASMSSTARRDAFCARSTTCRVSQASSSTKSTTCSSPRIAPVHGSAFSVALTRQLLGRVDVGPHPNGLAYDRDAAPFYSFNLGEPLGEGCTASIVDIDSMTVDRRDRRCPDGRAGLLRRGERHRLRQHPRPGADRADRSRRYGDQSARSMFRPRGRMVSGSMAIASTARRTAAPLVVIDRDSGERPDVASAPRRP